MTRLTFEEAMQRVFRDHGSAFGMLAQHDARGELIDLFTWRLCCLEYPVEMKRGKEPA